MALRYEDLTRFVRENGDVKGWAEKGELTLLKSGNVDSLKFWEQDAVRFDFGDRSYSRSEFEELVASKVSKT